MKGLFWLLLLACMAFFVFMRWGAALLGDDANMQLQPPLNEEKIRLLKTPPKPQPPLAAQAPVSSPAAATSQSTCMEWGEFSGDDLARAAAALDGLALGSKVAQRQVEHAGGYWVYIPPRQNRAETDKKVSQIKSLGIEEYFIVQEEGKWHNAISLGIFKTGETAQKFLDKLREKGVKSATVGERASKLVLTVFALKNPDTESVAKMVELQGDFPGSELKAVACE